MTTVTYKYKEICPICSRREVAYIYLDTLEVGIIVESKKACQYCKRYSEETVTGYSLEIIGGFSFGYTYDYPYPSWGYKTDEPSRQFGAGLVRRFAILINKFIAWMNEGENEERQKL